MRARTRTGWDGWACWSRRLGVRAIAVDDGSHCVACGNGCRLPLQLIRLPGVAAARGGVAKTRRLRGLRLQKASVNSTRKLAPSGGRWFSSGFKGQGARRLRALDRPAGRRREGESAQAPVRTVHPAAV